MYTKEMENGAALKGLRFMGSSFLHMGEQLEIDQGVVEAHLSAPQLLGKKHAQMDFIIRVDQNTCLG